MLRRNLALAASGLLALSCTLALAGCKGSPSRSSGTKAGASAVSSVGSLRAASDCRRDSDPCGCSERSAVELLRDCFVDKAFEMVESAGPACKNPGLLGVKAEALAVTGKNDLARSTASSLLTSDPKNRFARRALAIVRLNERDLPGAAAALDELVREDTADADSLYYSALVERARDHYHPARQGFLRVLRLNKRHIDARFNLATLTAAIGAKAEAQHHLDALLEITPVGDPRSSLAKTALAQAGISEQGKAPPNLVMQHEAPAPSSNR